MGGLSSEQISIYQEQGYLLLEDVIPPADLQPLIDEFNEVIDRKAREAQWGGEAERSV